MPTITESITMADGTCRVTLATPDDSGPRPGIVMYPDAGGARPVFRAMATRLAGLGYTVLVPDVYYRSGEWPPFDMAGVFNDAGERRRLFAMMKAITAEMMAADAIRFFDYLAARPEVSGQRFGTCGYCMGGRTSLIVAGRVPDRVAAAMSFHGGGLACDDPDSPHLLAERITAAVYVGAAENDSSYTPEQSRLLDVTLTEADVEHVINWYPASHGFAVADNISHDEAAAERHWQAMAEFFAATLDG